jgi:Leucine-rich repeat (LRR) protein
MDFSPILSLPNLKSCQMHGRTQDDVQLVAGNGGIRDFYAYDCQITSLEVFQNLPRLKRLEVDRNPIGDLSGLTDFQELEGLSIAGLPDVDLSPLLNMPSLETVVYSANMQRQVDLIKDRAAFQLILQEN